MTESHFVSACNENWIDTFESLAGLLPRGAVEHANGFTFIRTGIFSPEFNIVFALDRPKSLEGVSERIEALFIRENIPWQLVTTAESSEYLKPLVDDGNLALSEVTPGMVLSPVSDSYPPPPKDLEIRRADKPEEIHTFFRTGDAGFGEAVVGIDALENVLVSQASAAPSSIRNALYLGYVERKPVSTSLRSTTREVAGIYYVSTLPEFRGHGFGEAMVWKAVIDGHNGEGCTMSCLTASKMGRPVYERMGYRKIIDYHIWRGRN